MAARDEAAPPVRQAKLRPEGRGASIPRAGLLRLGSNTQERAYRPAQRRRDGAEVVLRVGQRCRRG